MLDHFQLVVEPGRRWPSWGRPARASPPSPACWPASTTSTAGVLVLDGVDVRDVPLAELRRAVGIVFEESFLFSDSIAANIAFAEPDADPATIRAAAEAAGAAGFIDDLPDGDRTEVGERGYSLSGGQRQRLAIARALVADPRVLVLDDATSAIDPAKERDILEALARLTATGTRTTLIISHRPATIALADRVVFLDEGRVAATGTHEQLLAGNARYGAVLATAVGEPA
ncbi:MAG: ATP-binding cassette domain-containing protein [Acidimicrobiales bacterium]